MKGILFLVLVCAFVFSCDRQSMQSDIPIRPASVSEAALWVAGFDGGVFVLVSKQRNLEPNEFWGEIYYVSGDTAYKGKLELVPSDSIFLEYGNVDSYRVWDGDTLYIVGDRQLKVID